MEKIKYLLIGLVALIIMPNVVNAELKVGDYVEMTPTKTSYTISGEDSGNTDSPNQGGDATGNLANQTINPSNLKLWRIIRINNDGTYDAISEYVSPENITIGGYTGYIKYIQTMNNIAKAYENSTYTTGSRMFGYASQTLVIPGESFTQYNLGKTNQTLPIEEASTDAISNIECNAANGVGGELARGLAGDTLYCVDVNLVKNVYSNQSETYGELGLAAYKANDDEYADPYWIASRYYGQVDGTVEVEFAARYIWGKQFMHNVTWQCRQGSGCSNLKNAVGVRPIIVLKSSLYTVKGDGTKANPYKLSTEAPSSLPDSGCESFDWDKAKDLTMKVGETFNYKKTIGTGNYTFNINDTSIASVDSNGVITAKKEGTTTLNINTSCMGVSVNITVNKVENTTKKATNGVETNVKIGDIIDLSNKIKNAKWTSSDETVAVVDSNGKVTAKAVGKTTIKAESDTEIFTVIINVYKKVSGKGADEVSILVNNELKDKNFELKVEEISESNEKFENIKNKIPKLNKMKLYNIDILLNNSKIQPNGEVILEFDIPKGYDKAKIAVFRVESDGTITKLSIQIINGKIQAKTNHFSDYVVAELTENTNVVENEIKIENAGSGDQTTDNPKTGSVISISLISILIVAGVSIYFYTKKKKVLFRV